MSVRVLFMGTPDFAVPVLEALVHSPYEVIGVVTQPDRPKGRKKALTPPPVKQAAVRYGLPVLQPERIRGEEACQSILDMQPDLIVTAAYGQLLPTPILHAPRYGCINVHASLLPKYRGGAPIHWAIINGERETGITLMYMVEELDAGDIIAQHAVPIHPQDTVGSLHDRLKELGARLLMDTMPALLAGQIRPTPQDDSKATYAPNLRREDERIDWHRTAEEVYNRIRGLNPWPVAYSTFRGETWKIWWGRPVRREHQAPPGTILEVTQEAVIVACGRDALEILQIQPSGKTRMTVADYLRGRTIQPGECFESGG
ncbi:MAG: methionyl-tRNA formyltransferase [Bacillus thermozeamaize]|uniref:Methionyl-tRNA formyltransferase n=1 Tax=Bacillus thermozeamaize TaxID=230954 RepID=A0A1Y3PK35_9BACI|nr:MAG: methionyl-tRNA formyltransferase [Bacillus thermozeamaize]